MRESLEDMTDYSSRREDIFIDRSSGSVCDELVNAMNDEIRENRIFAISESSNRSPQELMLRKITVAYLVLTCSRKRRN